MVDWSRNEGLVTLSYCLRGVYIILGRLSFRRDFTLVPSRVSASVYIILTEILHRKESVGEFTVVALLEGEFNSAYHVLNEEQSLFSV